MFAAHPALALPVPDALAARGVAGETLSTLVSDRSSYDRHYEGRPLETELAFRYVARFESARRKKINWYLADAAWRPLRRDRARFVRS